MRPHRSPHKNWDQGFNFKSDPQVWRVFDRPCHSYSKNLSLQPRILHICSLLSILTILVCFGRLWDGCFKCQVSHLCQDLVLPITSLAPALSLPKSDITLSPPIDTSRIKSRLRGCVCQTWSHSVSMFLADNSQGSRIPFPATYTAFAAWWSGDPRSPLLGVWSSGMGGTGCQVLVPQRPRGFHPSCTWEPQAASQGNLSPCWVWDGSSFGPEEESRYGIVGSGIRSNWVHVPALLFLVLCPWASSLAYISPSFHSLCEVEMVIAEGYIRIKWTDTYRFLKTGSKTWGVVSG